MNDTSFLEPLSDSDFSELLIRHMLLVPDVLQLTQRLNVTGQDMMIDDIYGNELYSEIVNIINGVGNAPISADALFNGLKRRFDDGMLEANLKQGAFELITYFYDTTRPLETADFFNGRLAPFIKKRRAHRLMTLYRDDITTLTAELNKLAYDLNSESADSRPRLVSPFSQLLIKSKNTLLGTGLVTLDKHVQGLMLGEFAIVIGFSGGGKTALGINIAGATAEGGNQAMYISCEEHEQDLAQRFYARTFNISYNSLRNSEANIELTHEWDKAKEMREAKLTMLDKNLKMLGMKGVTNINANYLYEAMLRVYEDTGFVPQLVMLDQMQFIEPVSAIRKGMPPWELEKLVAAELDELSHRKIGDKGFALWVQHQAKGKVKASFTREEIDGFKGIIHKPDLVLGVGREHARSDNMHIFSLKARHCADFSVTLKTELQYMRVTDDEIKDTLTIPAKSGDTMTEINIDPLQPAWKMK